MGFYGQGYSISRFLIEMGGRPRFLRFVRDGTQAGWDAATRDPLRPGRRPRARPRLARLAQGRRPHDPPRPRHRHRPRSRPPTPMVAERTVRAEAKTGTGSQRSGVPVPFLRRSVRRRSVRSRLLHFTCTWNPASLSA